MQRLSMHSAVTPPRRRIHCKSPNCSRNSPNPRRNKPATLSRVRFIFSAASPVLPPAFWRKPSCGRPLSCPIHAHNRDTATLWVILLHQRSLVVGNAFVASNPIRQAQ